jgi:hypothetical protein
MLHGYFLHFGDGYVSRNKMTRRSDILPELLCSVNDRLARFGVVVYNRKGIV